MLEVFCELKTFNVLGTEKANATLWDVPGIISAAKRSVSFTTKVVPLSYLFERKERISLMIEKNVNASTRTAGGKRLQ